MSPMSTRTPPFLPAPSDESTTFVNQLDAAQIDFCPTAQIDYSGVRDIGLFSKPVLFSFDPESFLPYLGPAIQGITYVHMRSQNIWQVDSLLEDLPNLKAIGYETSDPRVSIKDIESPDHPFAFARQQIKDRSIQLFAPGSEDDDFVDSGFLRFLEPRKPRS
ncbi:hypothetical protein JCM8115_004829 [Rhodotorula mucilaginosa]